MSTKSKSNEQQSEQVVEQSTESAAAERMARLERAKAEHVLLREWKRDGEKGERPATPTLDEMTLAYETAGCVPGSAGGKRTRRRTSSTPRTPAMSDVDLTRRLNEMLSDDPRLTQTAATAALTAEGATIRQVRAAYKVAAADRPKQPKPQRTPKVVESTKPAAKKSAPAKSAAAKKSTKAAAKSTTKPAAAKSSSTKKAAATKQPARKSTAATKRTSTRKAS